jgi:hypothetical protein
MKKSTLFILLLAAALGGYVYYAEFRHPKPKPAESGSQPLWSFNADDVAAIRIVPGGTGAGPAIALERHEGTWILTEPVQARGDTSADDALAGALARASSSRQLAPEPTRLKEYGLDPPELSVEIRLKNNQRQRLDLGTKDFTGLNVYARQGGSGSVLLLPDAVLNEASRPLNDLRDRAVLQFSSWSLAAMDFRTPKARFRLEKQGDYWNLLEPRESPAEDSEVTSLSSDLSAAKFMDVADENPPEAVVAGRYGLAMPVMTIRARNEKGEEATLLIGKKDGANYFARDAARSMVFRIEGSLVKKFQDASFESLRDKHLLRIRQEDITQFTIRNQKQTMAAAAGKDGKWYAQEPADRKGKEMTLSYLIVPIAGARATEVIDAPSSGIQAKLAKPVVEIKFTEKNGATTTVVFSAADGNSVYARTSRAPAVYKLDAYTLTQLNFSAAEAAP